MYIYLLFILILSILLIMHSSGFGESIATAVNQASLNSLQRLFKINLARSPLPVKTFNNETLNATKENESINACVIKNPDNIFTY